jgi:hypothetical protein
MVVPAEIMASGFMDSRAMDISEAPLGPASAAETSHLIDSAEMPLISAQSELALFCYRGLWAWDRFAELSALFVRSLLRERVHTPSST